MTTQFMTRMFTMTTTRIYMMIYTRKLNPKNLSRKNPKRYMLKKKIHLKDRIVSGTGW